MTVQPSPAIVTVTPNPGLDLTYTLPVTIRRDVDVWRATASTLEASGKGVNVSRALHAVGVPTCAVLPAGGPTGRYLTELLDDEHVPRSIVPQEGHTRVNTTALKPGGETVKVNGPGAALTSAEQEALLDATRVALEEARAQGGDIWLVVSGSLPPGVSGGAHGCPSRSR
jgi:1-phosphofructokinase